MPTESQVMEKIHDIDKEQGAQEARIDNLEGWVESIDKSLKGVTRNMNIGIGGFLAIETLFKLWGK